MDVRSVLRILKVAISGFWIAVFASAGFAIVDPARAADGGWRLGPDRVHIVYANLDVDTLEGRAELLRLVERAAMQLCDPAIGLAGRACVRATIDHAAAGPDGLALRRALEERRDAPVLR